MKQLFLSITLFFLFAGCNERGGVVTPPDMNVETLSCDSLHTKGPLSFSLKILDANFNETSVFDAQDAIYFDFLVTNTGNEELIVSSQNRNEAGWWGDLLSVYKISQEDTMLVGKPYKLANVERILIAYYDIRLPPGESYHVRLPWIWPVDFAQNNENGDNENYHFENPSNMLLSQGSYLCGFSFYYFPDETKLPVDTLLFCKSFKVQSYE